MPNVGLFPLSPATFTGTTDFNGGAIFMDDDYYLAVHRYSTYTRTFLWTRSGNDFTYLDSANTIGMADSSRSICVASGQYLFGINTGGASTLYAYSYDNTGFTLEDSEVCALGGNETYACVAFDAVNNYVYVGTKDTGAAPRVQRIRAYTWDGSNLTYVDDADISGTGRGTVYSVKATEDGYCWALMSDTDSGSGNDRIKLISFDGAACTLEDTVDCGTSAVRFDTSEIQNTGDYAYVAMDTNPKTQLVYSKSGSSIVTGSGSFLQANPTTMDGTYGYAAQSAGVASTRSTGNYTFSLGSGDSFEQQTITGLPTARSGWGVWGDSETWLLNAIDNPYMCTLVTCDFQFNNGVAPYAANITNVTDTCEAQSWAWDFGDGTTSTDKNPTKTYQLPGVYTIQLTMNTPYGSLSQTHTIRISDWDYTGSGNHVAYTDDCLRHAVNQLQGIGTIPWAGDNWLYPTAYTGTARGYDSNGNQISLVCHNRNGKFYRIGLPELWTDRYSTTYGGYEIPCKLKLKERTGVQGEYEELEHVESHAYMKPYDPSYRGAAGYDDEGFRWEHSVGLNIYEDGEKVTEAAKIENVPPYGDYCYRQKLSARTLQEEIVTDTSAWRLTKVQQLLKPVDVAASPTQDYPQEVQWQEEFAGQLLWISRDTLNPGLNRARGVACSGSYDTLLNGPDGQANSAMGFGAADGLTDTLAYLTGNGTWMSWLSGPVATPVTMFTGSTGAGGTYSIQLVEAGGVYSITFSDGVNWITRQLTYTGTGWVHLAVEKEGSSIRMLENGQQITFTPLADGTQTYGGATTWMDTSIVDGFDARIIQRNVSAAAILNYIDDVQNHSGDSGYLPVLR